MTSDFRDLMWEKIDGTISPHDERKLESHLSENDQARAQFDELVLFSRTIDDIDEVEPPAELQSRVEAQIDPARYARGPATVRPSLLERIVPFRFDFRFASALAAGVLLGVIGYHIASYDIGGNRTLDNDAFSGTIGIRTGLKIDVDGVDGIVDFRNEHDLATTSVRISSDRRIEVSLEYDGQPVHVDARAIENSPLHDISVDDDRISVSHIGEATYLASFNAANDTNAPLTITIHADGELLFEDIIKPEK